MKNIVIRNIPADLHKKIKVEAVQEGVTMNDKLIKIISEHFSSNDTKATGK